MNDRGACKHGHESWMDDSVCIECAREDSRNAAFDMVARILEETARDPKVDQVAAVSDLLKGIAKEILKLKIDSSPRSSDLADGRLENSELPKKIEALCPHCGGTGHITARIPDGTPYVLECIKCGNSIGGCIVGGESPLQEVPAPRECPYCGGLAEYRKADPDA